MTHIPSPPTAAPQPMATPRDGALIADSLRGRVALVAGAGSSGPGWSIGKATAVTLAQRGAAVIALDVSGEAAQDTCDEISRVGGVALAVRADVADEDSMRRALAQAERHFGAVHLYIANAGIGKLGGVMETSVEDLRRIQAVNMESLLIGSRLLIPAMAERGMGAIVTVSSVAGIRYLGYPHLAYSATKAGLIHFTRMMAQEYAPYGIRANTVVPGLIDTPRVQGNVGRAFSSSGDRGEVRKKRDAQVPMKRMGSPWEIARAVAFLCSDEASYITGTELIVDGGLTGRFYSAEN